MKILYVVHAYWPDHMAGTENYTHYLAQEMAENGHEVFVFTAEHVNGGSCDIEKYTEEQGVLVTKVHRTREGAKSIVETYEDEGIEMIFREVFDEIDPDIVHVQHLLNLSLGIVAYAKSKNVSVVYTLHDLWIECFQINRINNCGKLCSGASMEKCISCYNPAAFIKRKNTLDKIFLKIFRLSGYTKRRADVQIQKRQQAMQKMISNVDLFISPSRYLRDEFVQFGISDDKIMYSRNGMRILGEVKKKCTRIHNEKMIFVFTSNIQNIKGVDVLIEACEILERRGVKKFSMEFYGQMKKNKEEDKEFLERVGKLENVTYKGKFKNTDINNILLRADYLILPSIWPENAPLVIDEAYLNNVPCIVSNIGGMAERVNDSVNGLHFEIGDAHDLADKMQKVIENPELKEKFIKNIPHVKSIEENAIELEKVYNDMT